MLESSHYDVVVVGGAFSGSSLALLLKRARPETRILMVERTARFDRKVGEATVELSALFLQRSLGLWDQLSREHLPKHGLRFWFTDHPHRSLFEMSEVGPDEMPRLSAFQLDRARLDETLLQQARAAGIEVARPERVTGIELGWPQSRVELDERAVTCRWVVDASGRNRLLAKKLGLEVEVPEHPVTAYWCRWSGVLDLDGPDVTAAGGRSDRLPPIDASRRLATNHFCGRGYWCWVIPLRNGETSIGIVFHRDLHQFSSGGTPREQYLDFLRHHPGLRELTENAQPVEADFRSYAHLPYRTSQYAAPGWALVGDAAHFLDPYLSPGLDHAAVSVGATVRVLAEALNGLDDGALQSLIDRHNEQLTRSYLQSMDALYLGKYEIFGDAELVRASYLLDTSLYYLGVVGPAYDDPTSLEVPILGLDNRGARSAYRFMRLYNRRLAHIAARRHRAGRLGERNVGMRRFRGSFGLKGDALKVFAEGLRLWLAAEVKSLGLRPKRSPRTRAPGSTPTTTERAHGLAE